MPRSQATEVWFPGITASYSGGPIFWWKGHQITCLHCGCINLILYESLELTIYSITADGSYSAMSNLALKGITGIYAMGKINQLLEGYVNGADTNRTSYYLASFSYSSLTHDSLMFLIHTTAVRVNPIDFNVGNGTELCATMVEPLFVSTRL